MKFIGNLFYKDLYIPNNEVIILKDDMGTGKTAILNKYESYLKDNLVPYIYLKENKISEVPISVVKNLVTSEKYSNKLNMLLTSLRLCNLDFNKYLLRDTKENSWKNSWDKIILFVLLFYVNNSKVLLIDCDGHYLDDLYYLINYINPLLNKEDKQIILSTTQLKTQLNINLNQYNCDMLLK